MVLSVSRRVFTTSAFAATTLAAMPTLAAASMPEANTRQGRVRGFIRNGASVFLGLPYGADTSGVRRFHPPAPPASLVRRA